METSYKEEAEKILSQNPALLLKKINSIVSRSNLYFLIVFILAILLFIVSVLGSIYLLYVWHSGAAAILKFGFFAAIGFGAIALAIFKAFFSKEKYVSDYVLVRKDFPEFFSFIEELEVKFNTKIDEVSIDQSFNLGVTQVAINGYWGKNKNILILGLPLLLLLSKEELKAGLIHEFGHLLHEDSKSNRNIFEIRSAWLKLIHHIGDVSAWRAYPIMTYLNRVWPRLNVYTSVLQRHQEYRADTLSSDTVGKAVWAQSLLKIYIGDLYMKEFWDTLNKNILSEDTPPKDTYNRLIAFFKRPIDATKLTQWIDQVKFEHTRMYDSHPSFEDRLTKQAVSTDQDFLKNLLFFNEDNAASFYLSKKYHTVLDEFSYKFFNNLSQNWDNFLEYKKTIEENLDKSFDLTNKEEFYKIINARISKDGILSIEDEIENLLHHNPENVDLAFYKGMILLEKNDSKGEELLLNLVKNQETSYSEIAQNLYSFYVRNNLKDRALELEKLITEEQKSNEILVGEYNKMSLDDKLESVSLDNELVKYVQNFAKEKKYISQISLVKKNVGNNKKIELYIISLKYNTLSIISPVTAQNNLFTYLKERINSNYFIISARDYTQYTKKMNKIDGAIIYRK